MASIDFLIFRLEKSIRAGFPTFSTPRFLLKRSRKATFDFLDSSYENLALR